MQGWCFFDFVSCFFFILIICLEVVVFIFVVEGADDPTMGQGQGQGRRRGQPPRSEAMGVGGRCHRLSGINTSLFL